MEAGKGFGRASTVAMALAFWATLFALFPMALYLSYGYPHSHRESRVKFAGHYSEAKAKRFVRLAAAAYSPDPQRCLRNGDLNMEVIRRATVPCNSVSGNECAGYLAVSHSGKSIALVFRGSADSAQTNLPTQSALEEKADFSGNGHVSRYIHTAFQSVWRDGALDSAFNETAEKYPDYSLWVTGHSVGGAMASLAALLAVDGYGFDPHRIDGYVFGIPVVGDSEFAANFEKSVPNFWRITHQSERIAEITENRQKYRFHSKEVQYNSQMTDYIICAAESDQNCRRAKPNRFADNQFYFVHLGKYVQNECLELS